MKRPEDHEVQSAFAFEPQRPVEKPRARNVYVVEEEAESSPPPSTHEPARSGKAARSRFHKVYCPNCMRRLCDATIGTRVYCPICDIWTEAKEIIPPRQAGELFREMADG